MGWWSATILGGDSPMDDLGNMEDIAKLPAYDKDYNDIEYTTAHRKVQIEKHIFKLISYCERSYEPHIAYQVLGVLIMTCGAKMTKSLNATIVRSAQADDWRHEDKERQRFINLFIRQLRRYPTSGGRVRMIAYESLGDVFAKKIKSGKGGLVNRNV